MFTPFSGVKLVHTSMICRPPASLSPTLTSGRPFSSDLCTALSIERPATYCRRSSSLTTPAPCVSSYSYTFFCFYLPFFFLEIVLLVIATSINTFSTYSENCCLSFLKMFAIWPMDRILKLSYLLSYILS